MELSTTNSSKQRLRSDSESLSLTSFLFDLDGTLVDSYGTIQSSVNYLRRGHGLPPLDLPTIHKAVGRGVGWLLEQTLPGCDPEVETPLYHRHHKAIIGRTKTLPGVRRTIKSLYRRGCRLGICSNKPLALTQVLLAELKLEPLFEIVLGPESVTQRKPAPDMIEVAQSRFGVDSDQVLYVGDMTIDIETARAAGVPVWVIPTGSHDVERLREAKPDHIMTQFNELLSLVPRR
ncbi:Phosphoglycolate phosphatase, chromosomal [Planctomycetes bacterium Pan216]|uniref:phosphoglycolate phosphatase n=1 Tax=Kolteria novifilia TaxID=2527975 RepID=A0A518BA95_9BACT|nr:Phosphoglycolate phosphatase, chromosomal [Planctomycetes bacterium Pan216]